GFLWLLAAFAGPRRTRLATLAHEYHLCVLGIGIDELAEALEPGRIVQRAFPFALVTAHHSGHLLLQFGAEAELVVDDHGLQVVEAALQVFQPHRGALQAVGGADIEHQEAVDVADEGCVVEVGGKQVGMARAHAAVAADVEVPALVGGNYAEVLGLRLGAFAGAAGHRAFQFVRTAQALVAVLDVDRHAHAVLHAVTAPGATDTGFHRAQRLAVGVAGFEAGIDQFAPDGWQLVQPRAEQVDALAAGDLGIEVVLL